MAGWTKTPAGQVVYQDDSGLVHLRSISGEVQALPAKEAIGLIGDAQSGYSPASADDLNAAHDAAAKAAEDAKTSTLGAAARHVAIGAAGAVLAPGKLVSGLGAAALGVEDPLAKLSGRQVVTDLSAIGAHVMGGESEKTARETRETILADEAQHPIASGVGEATGAIAGSLPTGGGVASLAGRGAAAAGLVGRAAQVASGVAASTLEGAGLGADAAAEQAWIKGQPAATAEQTLAGIGLGGLFGGTAALGFSAAGPALSRFLGRGAKAEATGLEGAALRAEGEIGSAEAAATPGRATVAADEAVAPAALESVPESMMGKARKFASGLADDAAVKQIAHDQKPALRALGGGAPPSRELLSDAGRFLNESGIAGLGSDSAALERATAVSEAAGNKIGALMTQLDQKAPYVNARPLVNKLEDTVQTLRTEAWTPEQEQLANYIEKRTAKAAELSDAGIMTHSDLWKYRRELDSISGWGKTAPSRTKEAIREVRAMVEQHLEQAVAEGGESVGADVGAEYLQAKRAYRFGSWARDALEERVGVRSVANNLLGLKDYGVGMATLAASGGAALPALGAAIGTKIIRERGWGTIAWLARRAAADAVDVSAAPAGATATARAVQTMVARSESHMGDSIGRYLGTGSSESGLARGGARATTASALRSADLTSAQNAYKEHAHEVQTVATVPDVAASRISGLTGKTLPIVAPGLHAQIAAIGTRAASYLSANLPAPPTDPHSITPQLDSPPPVSRADLHIYANRVEGVEHPLSLLDDLNDGHVSPEKVEAVKAVWPQLFERMRQATFASLAQRKEQVPYKQRQALDLALDGAGTLEPSYSAESLQLMAQANEFQQKQLKQKPQRPSSGGTPQIGNMLQTSADRISAR